MRNSTKLLKPSTQVYQVTPTPHLNSEFSALLRGFDKLSIAHKISLWQNTEPIRLTTAHFVEQAMLSRVKDELANMLRQDVIVVFL